MRTGTLGNGNNGQWGWGYYAGDHFDSNKITVENHALGEQAVVPFTTVSGRMLLKASGQKIGLLLNWDITTTALMIAVVHVPPYQVSVKTA